MQVYSLCENSSSCKHVLFWMYLKIMITEEKFFKILYQENTAAGLKKSRQTKDEQFKYHNNNSYYGLKHIESMVICRFIMTLKYKEILKNNMHHSLS